jgi:hypothetical protein
VEVFKERLGDSSYTFDPCCNKIKLPVQPAFAWLAAPLKQWILLCHIASVVVAWPLPQSVSCAFLFPCAIPTCSHANCLWDHSCSASSCSWSWAPLFSRSSARQPAPHLFEDVWALGHQCRQYFYQPLYCRGCENQSAGSDMRRIMQRLMRLHITMCCFVF